MTEKIHSSYSALSWNFQCANHF